MSIRVLLIMTVLTVVSVTLAVTAAVPQIISYQGRLTTSGVPVANGNYLIKFAIYDALSSGTALWSCDYQTVPVSDGLFDVKLGAAPMPPLPSDLFSGDTVRYLGIKVGTDPEVVPRTSFTSVAYAYQALRADVATLANRADTTTFAISSRNADSADVALQSIRADSASHAVYADTAGYVSAPVSYHRIAFDSMQTITSSTVFVQMGQTLAVPPNHVRQFVMVQLLAGASLSTTGGSAIAYLEIRIGQSGNETPKFSDYYDQVGNSGTSPVIGTSGRRTIAFCYEPTAQEMANGFNVILLMKVATTGSASAAAVLSRSDLFGI